jgi:CBS domain containing-hemolysin-like protein
MEVPLSWTIIIICVLTSFFCSASETALASVNRFKMQVEADEGNKTAKLVLKVREKYDRALIAVLIGNNIVAIIASAVSTVSFYNLFKSTGVSNETVSIISSVLITFILYIFGDAFPKTIARSIPDTLSKILVYPIYFLMLLLYPITLIFDLMAKTIEKIFKVKEETAFNEEDFESIVEKVSEEGVIDEEQVDIIQSVLEFADTNVQEVLTPRNKIFALNIKNLTKEELHEIILKTNYSRIPVYDGNFDNVIGVLHLKSYFSAYLNDPTVSIRKVLQKPYFVSPDIMIDDLFTGFKRHHTHIAIVRNKDNKILGMVTMDDVLEELVEDISEPSHLKEGK